MSIKANPNLRNFWYSDTGKIKYARYKVLYGGRASSKTIDTAIFLLRLATRAKIRVLNTRYIQKRIEDSVYSEYKKLIYQDYNLLAQFDIKKDKIINLRTGSEFIFMGLYGNIEEIKGLADIDIVWIEEANTLKEETWEILKPTIRKEGSFFIITFNPKLPTDFVYQYFILNTPTGTQLRKINYNENPFLSKTMLEQIENDKKEMSEEKYRNIYLGEVLDSDEEAIFKSTWVDSTIEFYKDYQIPLNPKYNYIGFDVADSGEDKNAITIIKGGQVVDIQEWSAGEDELLQSSRKVWELARKYRAKVIYDNIGVGAGVGSHLKAFNARVKINKVEYIGLNYGDKVINPNAKVKLEGERSQVKNKDYFENLKAQLWYLIADSTKQSYLMRSKIKEFDNTTRYISIKKDIKLYEKLKTELTTPKKVMSAKYKQMVESKKDLQKRGVKSPNIADSFILAYAEIFGYKKGFKSAMGKR